MPGRVFITAAMGIGFLMTPLIATVAGGVVLAHLIANRLHN
jgi:hypothetical protein